MRYMDSCCSPLGTILLAADEHGLTGLWFEGQKYFAQGLEKNCLSADLPVFQAARRWLELYFSGKAPGSLPPLHLTGTPFQTQVWELLLEIPYGETVTYGQLAARLAEKQGVSRMSAQAVGGAVGRNRISLIVPCHRVVGADGSLTGYAGGLSRKEALLRLENAWKPFFHVPDRSKAP